MRKLTYGLLGAWYISHREFITLSNCDAQIFQLATNEPLFPLESFGYTVNEIHKILGSLMHKIIENGSQQFAVYISERLPGDFGTENIEKLARFLWSMLQDRPQDRESIAVLLNDPFLVG